MKRVILDVMGSKCLALRIDGEKCDNFAMKNQSVCERHIGDPSGSNSLFHRSNAALEFFESIRTSAELDGEVFLGYHMTLQEKIEFYEMSLGNTGFYGPLKKIVANLGGTPGNNHELCSKLVDEYVKNNIVIPEAIPLSKVVDEETGLAFPNGLSDAAEQALPQFMAASRDAAVLVESYGWIHDLFAQGIPLDSIVDYEIDRDPRLFIRRKKLRDRKQQELDALMVRVIDRAARAARTEGGVPAEELTELYDNVITRYGQNSPYLNIALMGAGDTSTIIAQAVEQVRGMSSAIPEEKEKTSDAETDRQALQACGFHDGFLFHNSLTNEGKKHLRKLEATLFSEGLLGDEVALNKWVSSLENREHYLMCSSDPRIATAFFRHGNKETLIRVTQNKDLLSKTLYGRRDSLQLAAVENPLVDAKALIDLHTITGRSIVKRAIEITLAKRFPEHSL